MRGSTAPELCHAALLAIIIHLSIYNNRAKATSHLRRLRKPFTNDSDDTPTICRAAVRVTRQLLLPVEPERSKAVQDDSVGNAQLSQGSVLINVAEEPAVKDELQRNRR